MRVPFSTSFHRGAGRKPGKGPGLTIRFVQHGDFPICSGLVRQKQSSHARILTTSPAGWQPQVREKK
jgi:hypothetical protein